MLPTLPLEVWYQIFAQCVPIDVTLVCKSWTAVVYSIPALWTHIRLRPAQFTFTGLSVLNSRLNRARNRSLHISIRADFTIDPAILLIVCTMLRTHSTIIDTLHLSADTAPLVAHILKLVAFQGDAIPCTISHLTLDLDDFQELRASAHDNDPSLSDELARGAEIFPVLRSLSLPALSTCLPIPSTPSTFEHLTTLVIVEPFISIPPGLYSICSLLSHTPRLETFYCKTSDIWSTARVRGLTSIGSFSSPEDPIPIPIPILLPRLTSAAFSVTGTGGDILACINAPALHDLHLDGSRSSLLSENEWSDLLHSQFLFTLRKLSLRSPRLHRLAITEAVLSKTTWHWFLCGGPLPEDEEEHLVEDDIGNDNHSGGTPFPYLETLAVRDFAETRSCGLDDTVLGQYAANPGLRTLKRLILRRCTKISGNALVSALRSIRDINCKNIPNEASHQLPMELEIVACPSIREHHLAAMEDLGIRVKWEADREDLNAKARCAEHEWWEGHRELVARTLEYNPEDWESEPARDEDPWWILDMKSLDPSDNRFF